MLVLYHFAHLCNLREQHSSANCSQIDLIWQMAPVRANCPPESVKCNLSFFIAPVPGLSVACWRLASKNGKDLHKCATQTFSADLMFCCFLCSGVIFNNVEACTICCDDMGLRASMFNSAGESDWARPTDSAAESDPDPDDFSSDPDSDDFSPQSPHRSMALSSEDGPGDS